MAPTFTELLERNKLYAQNHEAQPYLLERLPSSIPKIMIISCMDARVSPEKYLDLNLGDALVYRDGGGGATEAIGSIVGIDSVVQLETLVLLRHKDCGVIGWDDEKIRKMLRERAPDQAEEIDKMTFGKFKDEEQSIKDDVAFLKKNTLLRMELRDNTFGYLLDIKTGLIKKVA